MIDRKATRDEGAESAADGHDGNRHPGGFNLTDDHECGGDSAKANGLHQLAYFPHSHAVSDQAIRNVARNIEKEEGSDVGNHCEQANRGIVHSEAFVDERRQPGKQHVQRPVVAEVGDDDCPDRAMFEKF